MKKIVLIPDSFKGTLSSTQVCALIADAIHSQMDAQVVSVPVADGGEGSVDAFLSALPGEKITLPVQNPFGEEMIGFYGRIHQGKTAVIEMAACAGLPLAEGRLNPCITTTYGVGQLIAHALEGGCEHIILGLGGSATNDGGAGCAAALGAIFTNAQGEVFVPTGGTLQDIAHIDLSGLHPKLATAKVTVMCDIDNPLYGPTGAAYIFAPQKGADAPTVALLDQGLRHYATRLQEDLHQDVAHMAGAGAAGGFGAGAAAILGANLQMGIDTVLETVGFDALISDANLIITGEGKLDSQSLRGKVVVGVAKAAKAAQVPVIALVGAIDADASEAYDLGVSAMFSINRRPEAFETARYHSEENLRATATDLIRLLLATGGI